MIVDNHLLYQDVIPAAGILFVGDPHVTSIRPGRRNDPDWPGPILRKLEHVVAVANEKRLVPVGLGDLLDVAVEPDESLKLKLARILKRLWMPWIANVGNHEIQNTTLSDGDTLAYLAFTDTLDAVKFSGPVCVVEIGGRRFGLGMTPYGQDIPTDVRGVFGDLDPHTVIWVTHHDVAFQGAYPGAMHPFPIDGCRLVVNGHMHGNKPHVQVGSGDRRTTWMNPGNITRQTVDMIDHVPCAFMIGADARFVSVPLPHAKGVFDLTGRLVEPAKRADVMAEATSAFVDLLRSDSTTDMARSSDGSLLREDIVALFESRRTPDAERALIDQIWREAVSRRNAD